MSVNKVILIGNVGWSDMKKEYLLDGVKFK